jgi:DNA-binding transcriptional MocR family regulator
MSVVPGSGVISFARGVPSPDLFPVRELEEASRRAFARHSATALNYGPPAGFRPLQEWLGSRHGVAPGRIIVTPGSYVLIGLLVPAALGSAALGPTASTVLVEGPTYDRVTALLRETGVRVVSIRRDGDGLDFAALERYLGTGERPAFFYVMPTCHNPTGTTLSLAERERLADLAYRHGLLLVEDDPYGQLTFAGDPPPSVHALLEARGAGHLAVFASSFSKIVAPGLRVGYGVLPEHLTEAVTRAATHTYVSPPIWPQAEVYEFLAAGFLPGHLSRIRAALRQRRDALAGGLEAGLGGHARWTTPDGGYFLWLELPGAVRTGTLLAECEQAGVTFVPGPGFFFDGGGENCARLCFSFPSLDDIRAGADRLAAVVRRRLDLGPTTERPTRGDPHAR